MTSSSHNTADTCNNNNNIFEQLQISQEAKLRDFEHLDRE
jgi:hypothetical protein